MVKRDLVRSVFGKDESILGKQEVVAVHSVANVDFGPLFYRGRCADVIGFGTERDIAAIRGVIKVICEWVQGLGVGCQVSWSITISGMDTSDEQFQGTGGSRRQLYSQSSAR